MHGAGYEFFTGSAFAIDENRAAGGSYGADGLFQLLQRGTYSDDVVERVARGRVAAQGKILTAERNPGERAGDGEFDLVHEAGTLADVIGRAAGLDRLDGGLVVVDGSHQNDGGIGRNLVGVAQDFDAVDGGHLDVGHDHVEQGAVDLALGRFAAGDGFHFMAIAAQGNVEQFADGALVVADQDVTHGLLLPPQPARLGQSRTRRRLRPRFPAPARSRYPCAADGPQSWCPCRLRNAPTP